MVARINPIYLSIDVLLTPTLISQIFYLACRPEQSFFIGFVLRSMNYEHTRKARRNLKFYLLMILLAHLSNIRFLIELGFDPNTDNNIDAGVLYFSIFWPKRLELLRLVFFLNLEVRMEMLNKEGMKSC